MNTKALRQKILDLAIHGKLVPQNPKDESATVLLERIRAEKAEKIKQGELKADKKDSFIFVGSDKRHYEQFADGTVKDIEDEIPFDVPEGWAWCRLGEIANLYTGNSINENEKTNKYSNLKEGLFYIATKDINFDGKIDYDNGIKIPSSEFKFKIAPAESTLLCIEGGSAGRKIGFINQNVCFVNKLCCFHSDYLKNLYLFYYLQSRTFKDLFNTNKNGLIGGVSLNLLKRIFFPLPPLAVQERIVSRIKNIFSQIGMLENNKFDLQTAIKQAKSKILDLAIHGKLVPQNPNDEPAEELLKRIATSDNRPYKKFEDEVPFDLPDTWEWCNLDDIYNHTTGKALKKSNSTGTLHKYITTSNLYWNSFDFTEVRSLYFTDEELEKCTIKKGDLILCNGGDVGRAAIWNYDYDICYQNHVSRLRPKFVDINNYFYLYLLMLYKESGLLAGKGIGITSLSASDLLTTTLPLPPLAEQQRIVTKIEELFAQLDSISEQLA